MNRLGVLLLPVQQLGRSKLQQTNAYPINMRMGSMTPNRFTAAEILAAKRQNETLEGSRIEGNVIMSGKCE